MSGNNSTAKVFTQFEDRRKDLLERAQDLNDLKESERFSSGIKTIGDCMAAFNLVKDNRLESIIPVEEKLQATKDLWKIFKGLIEVSKERLRIVNEPEDLQKKIVFNQPAEDKKPATTVAGFNKKEKTEEKIEALVPGWARKPMINEAGTAGINGEKFDKTFLESVKNAKTEEDVDSMVKLLIGREKWPQALNFMIDMYTRLKFKIAEKQENIEMKFFMEIIPSTFNQPAKPFSDFEKVDEKTNKTYKGTLHGIITWYKNAAKAANQDSYLKDKKKLVDTIVSDIKSEKKIVSKETSKIIREARGGMFAGPGEEYDNLFKEAAEILKIKDIKEIVLEPVMEVAANNINDEKKSHISREVDPTEMDYIYGQALTKLLAGEKAEEVKKYFIETMKTCSNFAKKDDTEAVLKMFDTVMQEASEVSKNPEKAQEAAEKLTETPEDPLKKIEEGAKKIILEHISKEGYDKENKKMEANMHNALGTYFDKNKVRDTFFKGDKVKMIAQRDLWKAEVFESVKPTKKEENSEKVTGAPIVPGSENKTDEVSSMIHIANFKETYPKLWEKGNGLKTYAEFVELVSKVVSNTYTEQNSEIHFGDPVSLGYNLLNQFIFNFEETKDFDSKRIDTLFLSIKEKVAKDTANLAENKPELEKKPLVDAQTSIKSTTEVGEKADATAPTIKFKDIKDFDYLKSDGSRNRIDKGIVEYLTSPSPKKTEVKEQELIDLLKFNGKWKGRDSKELINVVKRAVKEVEKKDPKINEKIAAAVVATE